MQHPETGFLPGPRHTLPGAPGARSSAGVPLPEASMRSGVTPRAISSAATAPASAPSSSPLTAPAAARPV